jgi:hypothetical protein
VRKEQTDRFEAEAADGERCVIVEYTTVSSSKAMLHNHHTPAPRTKSFVALDGRSIYLIGDTQFRDVMSEQIFVRLPT